jgi:hypothetical protein
MTGTGEPDPSERDISVTSDQDEREIGSQAKSGVIWPVTGRDVVSVMSLAIMAAATLRVVAAVTGAVAGWEQAEGATHGQRLGYSLQFLGGFGDGQGAALLLAALGLLWWQRYQSRDGHLTGNLWRRWLAALFVVSAAGAAIVIAGIAFVYAGVGSTRIEWEHLLASGGFSLAYLVVSVAGTITCWRMAPAPDTQPSSNDLLNPYLEGS